jgi:hypothetical protein
MKKIILICFISSIWVSAFSQNRYNYFTVGGHLSAMSYFGDLNPKTNFASTNVSLTRPGFGFELSYKATPRFHFRSAIAWGRLRGDDFESASEDDLTGAFYRYTRNLNFRNDILELSLVGMWDFIPNSRRFYRRQNVVPYVFGGVATFYSDPRGRAPDSLGGKWVRLRPLNTEGQGKDGYAKPYSPINIAFPVGLGAKFKIADRLDLSIEVGYRFTLTDYLDDVGGLYPDPSDLDSDLARIMSNPSGLAASTVSGEARNLALINQNLGFITLTPQNGSPYISANGYGRKGDTRGGSTNKDSYLVTAFRLNYIFSIKRYRPINSKEK